jgi:hypothetical protein
MKKGSRTTVALPGTAMSRTKTTPPNREPSGHFGTALRAVIVGVIVVLIWMALALVTHARSCSMVPFYESYIPVKCKGYPDRAKVAFEALARRDQYLIERAMNGEPDDRTWLPPLDGKLTAVGPQPATVYYRTF